MILNEVLYCNIDSTVEYASDLPGNHVTVVIICILPVALRVLPIIVILSVLHLNVVRIVSLDFIETSSPWSIISVVSLVSIQDDT